MSLNIKDPESERIVRELARETGESITDAVRIAADERLARVRQASTGGGLVDEIGRIAERCSALPVVDGRQADEILGWDENGLPG